MKKNYLFAVALVAAALTGCSQDELVDFNPEVKSGFTASLETVESRTVLDANNKVQWVVSDDHVSLFEKVDINAKYQVSSVNDNGTAKLTYVSHIDKSDYQVLDQYYAVYPYNDKNTIATDGTITAPVPAAYTYKDKESCIASALMVARSDSKSLRFTNAQGIIRLKLNAVTPHTWGKIQSITFTSKANYLSGTATMSWSGTDTPVAVIDTDAEGKGQSLTINLDESLKKDLPSKQSGEYVEFYVPVVPTTFAEKDLTMVVTFANNKTYELKDIEKEIAIARKEIVTLRHTIGSDDFSADIEEGLSENISDTDALISALNEGKNVILQEDITLAEGVVIPATANSTLDLNGKTLTLGENEIQIDGNLVIKGGIVNVTGDPSGGDLYVGIVPSAGSTVEIKNTTMTVSDGNVGIASVSSSNPSKIFIIDSNITVDEGGYGVFANFADVNINVENSQVTGNGCAIRLDGGIDAYIKIDEQATVGTIGVMGSSTATITYYGETVPTVEEDNTNNTVIIRKGTSYEGITQNPDDKKEYYIDNKQGLMQLNALFTEIKPSEANIIKVNLMSDIDLAGETWSPINSMWITFNGNGHTISNLNAGLSTDGRRSGFWGYAGAVTINDLTLESVTATGSQAGTFVGSAEGTKINNCYLKGTNTVDYVAGVETWNGIGAITGVLTNSNINVTIMEGTTVALNRNDMATDFGCKYIDDLTGHISANKGTVTNEGTVISNGEISFVVSNTNDLSTSLSNGGEIQIASGEYNLTSVSDKEVTISGSKDAIITIEKPNYGGSDVTFNGVTVRGSGYATGIQHVKTVTYNQVSIVGGMCLYGEKVVFNGCDFTLNNQYIWTYGAKEVEFINCTFDTTGKAVLIYNEGAGASKVTVKGCTFYASASAQASAITNQNCAAIEIDNFQNSGIGAAHVLITENNSYSNYFSGEWRIKKYTEGNSVTVNSVAYTSIAIDGKLMTIDGNSNVTISE